MRFMDESRSIQMKNATCGWNVTNCMNAQPREAVTATSLESNLKSIKSEACPHSISIHGVMHMRDGRSRRTTWRAHLGLTVAKSTHQAILLQIKPSNPLQPSQIIHNYSMLAWISINLISFAKIFLVGINHNLQEIQVEAFIIVSIDLKENLRS